MLLNIMVMRQVNVTVSFRTGFMLQLQIIFLSNKKKIVINVTKKKNSGSTIKGKIMMKGRSKTIYV